MEIEPGRPVGCGSEIARPGFRRNSVGVVGVFATFAQGGLVPRDPGLEDTAPLGLILRITLHVSQFYRVSAQ